MAKKPISSIDLIWLIHEKLRVIPSVGIVDPDRAGRRRGVDSIDDTQAANNFFSPPRKTDSSDRKTVARDVRMEVLIPTTMSANPWIPESDTHCRNVS
jgi:hypothetical protein